MISPVTVSYLQIGGCSSIKPVSALSADTLSGQTVGVPNEMTEYGALLKAGCHNKATPFCGVGLGYHFWIHNRVSKWYCGYDVFERCRDTGARGKGPSGGVC